VRLLWLFRTKLSDPLTLDPDTALGWDEYTINPRRGENATDRIPEPILGPLMAWALRWVNDFSDDLLTAHAEWLRLHVHTHNNRQRRGAERVPDIPGRLRTLLNRYRQEPRPLPRGDKGVNRTHLAREIGCAHSPLFGITCGRIIDEAVAELGIYLRTPINARLDGQPWRGAIAYTDVEQLDRLLQLACYVVIAYLSGMRDSEVKHLQRRCLTRRVDDTGHTYRRTVTSQAFKGEGTVSGVSATWIVTEPVEQAITVLEQLQPSAERFLFAVLPSSRHFLNPRETSVKSTTQTNNDLAAFVDWINTYCASNNRPDVIPFVRSQRWRLTSSQFRRTLAWFIARRPGGVIAGALQYRHQKIQMFEGYAKSRVLHQVGEKPQVARSWRCRNSVSDLRMTAA
jgi:hypothetical protein